MPLSGDGTQHSEEILGALHRGPVRCVQPLEIQCPGNAEGMQEEDHLSQIRPLNFGGVSGGTIQVPALGPQSPAGARSCPTGAARALISRCAADLLQGKRLNATVGIVSGDSGQSTINHMADPIDGDAGFSNVGGNDDLPDR